MLQARRTPDASSADSVAAVAVQRDQPAAGHEPADLGGEGQRVVEVPQDGIAVPPEAELGRVSEE